MDPGIQSRLYKAVIVCTFLIITVLAFIEANTSREVSGGVDHSLHWFPCFPAF